MSLRLITGPACAGKTESIYGGLVARARSGCSSLLLVPSGPDVSRALARLAVDAPLGLAISTFDDFLDHAWTSHGDGRQIVSITQRVALLTESANTALAREPLPVISMPGFVRSLSTVVQRAAESPSPLPRRSSGSSPAAALLRCAVSYADSLSLAGLVERAEAHRLVATRAGEVNLPGLIAVNGFTGLTAAQEAFLTAAGRSTDVLISLTFDFSVAATVSAAELVDRLAALGERVHLNQVDNPERPPELARIDRSLGAVGDSAVQARGDVVFSEAWGETAEAARIAREVQDAVAQDTRPGAIAIVYRDVAPHLRDLRSALADVGVAAEFDTRIPFHLSGLGRTLLALLDFGGDGPGQSQLLDVLRSPFSPASDEAADDLDAFCRRSRTGGIGRIQRWCADSHPEISEFLRQVRRACRDVAGPEAERRWYRLISDMLARARPGEVSTDSDALMDAASARVFMEAVRGLDKLPGTTVTPDVLASVLREVTISVASTDRPDSVQVMGAERVRGRRFDCVIMAGLQEGEFPRRTTEDALSAPKVAVELASHGVDVALRSGTAEERLLFYQAITRAFERLILSWQSHDADGRPLRPSVFLEEVLDLYRDPAEGTYFAGEPPLRVLGLDSFAEHAEAPRSARRSARARAGTCAGVPGDPADALIDAARRAHRGRPAVSDGVRAIMAKQEVFSASGIETYLQCPFRWYTQRLIQPRELDERLDAAARGHLAHDIMRRFYEVLVDRTGNVRVTPASLEAAKAIHEEASTKALAEVRVTTAAEAAAARATARRTLRLVEADAVLLPGMSPLKHEWSFGMDEDDPPEAFGTFWLVGRIDRIDADAEHLVVTDYKLGTIDSRRGMAAFEAEGLVQLPLYAAVAARRLGRAIAGGVYRSVSGSKPRGFIHPDLAGPAFVKNDTAEPAEIEGAIAHAIERAAEAVEAMRRGDIRAEPRGGSCPDYCPARAFCAEWRH